MSRDRPRTTVDSWELHINYGDTWEHEVTEFTRKDAIRCRDEYRQNCPQYPCKIVKRRIPKTELTKFELRQLGIKPNEI